MKRTNDKKYDENIISALQSLSIPLMSFDGHKVYFENNKRNETIFEHIANKRHRFSVSDIKAIPSILKDEESLQKDKKKGTFRNYIGKRTKKNDKTKYIKIITRKADNNKETVVSIYLIKEKN